MKPVSLYPDCYGTRPSLLTPRSFTHSVDESSLSSFFVPPSSWSPSLPPTSSSSLVLPIPIPIKKITDREYKTTTRDDDESELHKMIVRLKKEVNDLTSQKSELTRSYWELTEKHEKEIKLLKDDTHHRNQRLQRLQRPMQQHPQMQQQQNDDHLFIRPLKRKKNDVITISPREVIVIDDESAVPPITSTAPPKKKKNMTLRQQIDDMIEEMTQQPPLDPLDPLVLCNPTEQQDPPPTLSVDQVMAERERDIVMATETKQQDNSSQQLYDLTQELEAETIQLPIAVDGSTTTSSGGELLSDAFNKWVQNKMFSFHYHHQLVRLTLSIHTEFHTFEDCGTVWEKGLTGNQRRVVRMIRIRNKDPVAYMGGVNVNVVVCIPVHKKNTPIKDKKDATVTFFNPSMFDSRYDVKVIEKTAKQVVEFSTYFRQGSKASVYVQATKMGEMVPLMIDGVDRQTRNLLPNNEYPEMFVLTGLQCQSYYIEYGLPSGKLVQSLYTIRQLQGVTALDDRPALTTCWSKYRFDTVPLAGLKCFDKEDGKEKGKKPSSRKLCYLFTSKNTFDETRDLISLKLSYDNHNGRTSGLQVAAPSDNKNRVSILHNTGSYTRVMDFTYIRNVH